MTVTDERLRAKRTVVECDAGWAVTDSDFVTTDRALAVAVAAELDRVEPLDRTLTRDEAIARTRQLLGEMETLLDAGQLDQVRMDALRDELDVLNDRVRFGSNVKHLLAVTGALSNVATGSKQRRRR